MASSEVLTFEEDVAPEVAREEKAGESRTTAARRDGDGPTSMHGKTSLLDVIR